MFQNVLERALKVVAPDRLAIAFTALSRAKIIRIFLRLALRPTGRQRRAAVVAQDEPAQRKVSADILARRRFGRAFKTRLYLLERLKAYQALMLTFAQTDTPIFRLDVARIDRAAQQVRNTLVADFAVRQVFRKGRLLFEKAFDLDLRLETPCGIAFERFLYRGCVRFIAHQQLAVSARAFIAIADRGLKHPVAVLHTRTHAVDGLLTVLLALMLRDGGQQVLNQLRVRVLAEFNRRADQDTAGFGDLHPQLKMRHQAACKAADIVNDNGMRFFALRLQISEHGLHARTGGEAAGAIVAEDFDNLITLVFCKLAAARFLRSETVTPDGLLSA